MTNIDQALESGSLLLIETGSYSDKEWHGPVRVLREFTRREVADRYLDAHPTDISYGNAPSAHDFLPWLIKEGYVEHVDGFNSWHVGDYEFEP